MNSFALLPLLHLIRDFIWIGFVLWIVLIVAAAVIFNQASKLEESGKRRAAIGLLGGLGLLGPLAAGYREAALYKLVVWHAKEGDCERAIILSRRLDQMPVSNALGRENRRRRIECLNALQRTEEARQESETLWTATFPKPKNRVTLSNQATMLAREGRAKAAYETFKELLAQTPITARTERDQTLGQLMTQAQLAGDGDAVLPWAQQLLAESRSAKIRCMGYSMAAIGASNIGDLDLAEQYTREGIAYAKSQKREKEAATGMAYLATLLGRRPDPVAALDLLNRTISEYPKHTRQTLTNKAELLYSMGRFEEGMSAAREAMQVNPLPIPAYEARQRALLGLILARGYSMVGDLVEFRRQMQESSAALTDGKLALICEAMTVYGAALAGDVRAAQTGTEQLLLKREGYLDDKMVQQTCLSNMSRAAWKLRNWTACRRFTEEYDTLTLSPAERAMPRYLLGECDRAGGDEASARRNYSEAAAVHPELYWSHLAAQALRSA